MTIEFYGRDSDCAKSIRDMTKIAPRLGAGVTCLKVKVSDVTEANRCGLRPVPLRRVTVNSAGYVVGRNISEFKGCGLKLSRTRRR